MSNAIEFEWFADSQAWDVWAGGEYIGMLQKDEGPLRYCRKAGKRVPIRPMQLAFRFSTDCSWHVLGDYKNPSAAKRACLAFLASR